MPTVLALDALLAPVPGGDPGGLNPNRVPARAALDQARKKAVEDGHALPVTDSSRVKMWQAIQKDAQELLTTKTKSLEAATRVTEAAARGHGFAGARDGFVLLRRLADEWWDQLWPRIDLSEADEEEDPADRENRRRDLLADALQARESQFNWLDDPDGGARFPGTLRELAVVQVGGVAVGAADVTARAGADAKVSLDEMRRMAATLGREKIRAALAEVTDAVTELDALRAALEAKFAAAGGADLAPTFRDIRNALDDCLRVANDLDEMAGGDTPDAAAGGDAAAGSPDRPAGDAGAAAGASRDALYRQLTQIAGHLARLEPHSPVPLLLLRVVELQTLPFPELVRQLNKEERVLGFLERSLIAPPGE